MLVGMSLTLLLAVQNPPFIAPISDGKETAYTERRAQRDETAIQGT